VVGGPQAVHLRLVAGIGCRLLDQHRHRTSVRCTSTTLVVDGAEQTWQPLTREEFRQLRRDDRLRDRTGHEWTVRATAYLDAELGEYRVVLVSGAQVLVERERFCEGYVVVAI
jgi:hypothetical protein